MEFCIQKNSVYFINLKNIPPETLMFYINKLIFFSEPPEFLNFHRNENDGEISMLISEDGLSLFGPVLCLEGIRKYKCACIINTYDYIDDTGMVRQLSAAFGEEHIPILYITTLNNNFILFDEAYSEKSMEILRSLTKFVVFSQLDSVV